MKIILALMAVSFVAFLVPELENAKLAQMDERFKVMEVVDNIKELRQIAEVTRRALERADANPGACPAGTKLATGLNISARLCWANLDNSNCFQIKSGGANNDLKTICLSRNQVSVARSVEPFKIIALPIALLNLMVESAQASSSSFWLPPITDYVPPPADNGSGNNSNNNNNNINSGSNGNYGSKVMGNYTGIANSDPVRNAANVASGSVVVRRPTNNATNLNSNHIQCNRADTECFTITFCMDGTPSCGSNQRIAQTYGLRSY